MSQRNRSGADGSFDAVLIVAFGGPQGLDDVRLFLENVVRGRPVAPERLEEAVRRYGLFGGRSPLTEITFSQARGLETRLHRRGIHLPVHVGMRNWHPFLADTFRDMSSLGVRRVIGFVAGAYHSPSSCAQYRQAVNEARERLMADGGPHIEIAYVDSWYEHPGFIDVHARHIRDAIDRLPSQLQSQARIVFTAHSIPTAQAQVCRYQDQLLTSACLISQRLDREDWVLVYQSRSGRPEDPWLLPDICDYLRMEGTQRPRAVVICPIGFLCDHIEVLYDLDRAAAAVCNELNIPMVRAETVNDDPVFLDAMADIVQRTWDRYREFPPLPIVAATPAPRARPQ